MLVMFRTRNFASFKDEIILDMRAVSYKEMKSHVIDTGRNKVVKSLAIFGKNASGKSNLISALYFFESFVLNQFFQDDTDAIDNAGKLPNIRRIPFKLSKAIDATSEFEIIFSCKGKTFQYGFMLDDQEQGPTKISEEWLLLNEQLVFERKANKITSGKNYRKEIEKMEKVRNDRLYIGTLDYFAEDTDAVKEVVDDIKMYLKENFNVHFELIIESTVKGIAFATSYSERLFKDEEYKRIVEDFVKSADIGITRIDIKPNKEASNNGDKYDIRCAHNKYDENGEIIGEELFELNMESSGTIRYFSFIQYILDILEKGGVFVIDEFSARLHPILTKFVIDLFQSSKNSKAQIIFTTHDISLMNRKQMRRDEIALVEKNERGESSVYTLADIKARSDASFSKDYMSGKYGAIPIINESWLDSKQVEGWLWAD